MSFKVLKLLNGVSFGIEMTSLKTVFFSGSDSKSARFESNSVPCKLSTFARTVPLKWRGEIFVRCATKGAALFKYDVQRDGKI